MIKKNGWIAINLFCFIACIAWLLLSWQYLAVATQRLQNDYKTFYKALRHHNGIYQTHYYVRVLQKKIENKKLQITYTKSISAINLNTPGMSVLLKILVNLHADLVNNALIWVLVSFMGAGMSLLVLMQYVRASHAAIYGFLPFLLALCLSWPGLYNQVLGQISFLLLPILCVAFLLSDLNRPVWAAIILGLLASLKLFFLLFFLWFLMRREWRSSLLFIASFCIFFFAPILIFSGHTYVEFFQVASNTQALLNRSGLSMNGSLLGFLMKLLLAFKIPASIMQIRIAVSIMTLYVVVRWMIYYQRHLSALSEHQNALSFCFIIVLGILLSPLGWIYYYLFLLIPIFVFFQISRTYALSRTFFICFALALSLTFLPWWITRIGSPMYYVRQFSAFVDLIFWFSCLHQAVRAVRAGAQAMYQQHQWVAAFPCCYVVVGICLVLMHYGFPVLLPWATSSDYPGFWLPQT